MSRQQDADDPYAALWLLRAERERATTLREMASITSRDRRRDRANLPAPSWRPGIRPRYLGDVPVRGRRMIRSSARDATRQPELGRIRLTILHPRGSNGRFATTAPDSAVHVVPGFSAVAKEEFMALQAGLSAWVAVAEAQADAEIFYAPEFQRLDALERGKEK